MGEKEVRAKIIVKVFDLEVKFSEIALICRDLGRLLIKLKDAEA